MAILRRQITQLIKVFDLLLCCKFTVFCVVWLVFSSPDAQLGLFGALHVSMGQILSLPWWFWGCLVYSIFLGRNKEVWHDSTMVGMAGVSVALVLVLEGIMPFVAPEQ